MFDPARGYPMIVPYLRYPDPERAVQWFVATLGARVAVRLTMPDGRIGHAELALGGSVFSLGLLSEVEAERRRPTRHTLSSMIVAFVDDVDAAVERGLAAGGELIDPPADQPWGLRQAILADPGGHLWELSRHLQDVPPSAWGAEQVSDLPGSSSATSSVR
ncbi:MAG: VOC family protein [Actinobacteria bacterium]|nr:VOC family protein [Actinomycetota bacterium]